MLIHLYIYIFFDNSHILAIYEEIPIDFHIFLSFTTFFFSLFAIEFHFYGFALGKHNSIRLWPGIIFIYIFIPCQQRIQSF